MHRLGPEFIPSASVRMFLAEVTLEQVDRGEQVALPGGGGPLPTGQRPKEVKKPERLISKTEHILPGGFHTGTSASFLSSLERKHQLLLSLEAAGLQTGIHTLGAPGSPAG